MNILDNLFFKGHKEAIKAKGMTWELVPVGMHQRNVAEKQQKLSKEISNLFFVGLPKTFQLICGIVWYHKQNSCVISSTSLMWRQKCKYRPTHLEHMISIECHWHRWVVNCKYKKNRVRGKRGVSTQWTDGTSRHLHITIGVLRNGVNTQEQSKFQTQCF